MFKSLESDSKYQNKCLICGTSRKPYGLVAERILTQAFVISRRPFKSIASADWTARIFVKQKNKVLGNNEKNSES